jgi:hypothetical protein
MEPAATAARQPGAAPPAACPTCGHAFAGPYCHHCGERKLGPKEYTFRNFAGSFIETVFSVDNKLLRSLLALLRPGLLTADYLRGKRVPYIRPLQLFFFVNVVYFFVQPISGINTFNSTLSIQFYYQSYSEDVVQPLVRAHIKKTGIDVQAYTDKYNALSNQLARTLVFLMVPLWACILWVITLGLGRTFATQFVLAMHTMTFLLLFYYSGFTPLHYHLVNWLADGLGQKELAQNLWGEEMLNYTLFPFLAVYTALSLRKLFAITWIGSILRTFVALYVFFYVVTLYRFILFFITFWLVG